MSKRELSTDFNLNVANPLIVKTVNFEIKGTSLMKL